ncbi:MAG: helix-turn-helix transcriptional regulator [Planctomycetaceae bacterium]|nr:helix-turn-helix transcriptional regulator [Planctomycetaceae bacterium]
MGKMPDALRETIARNIRDCRLNKFPGRGGGKRCAEAFGVSPQQWSPWESGKRTPDELRLEQIASFFGTTVEWFRRDHRNEGDAAPLPPSSSSAYEVIRSHTLGTELTKPRNAGSVPLDPEGEDDINHYLWVIDILTRKLTTSGVRVVVTFERMLPGA